MQFHFNSTFSPPFDACGLLLRIFFFLLLFFLGGFPFSISACNLFNFKLYHNIHNIFDLRNPGIFLVSHPPTFVYFHFVLFVFI